MNREGAAKAAPSLYIMIELFIMSPIFTVFEFVFIASKFMKKCVSISRIKKTKFVFIKNL